MPIKVSDHWQQFVLKDKTNSRAVNVYMTNRCKFYTGQNSLIFDCDKIKSVKNVQKPINDCIAFEKDDLLYVAIVEFKGRRPDFDHAIAQLCSGKDFAEQIIKDSEIKEKYKMYLIIVAKSHPSSGARLRYTKRKSLKSKMPILTARCRDTFSDVRKKDPAY